ncbi:MAG: peptidyl-prolyl cis-trans isomerase D, partial [Dinoroseobacter sp.]
MKGKASNIFIYILLGLLILGLAGFGVTSFGGNFGTVGRVGETEVTVEDYARAMQTELRAATQQTGRNFTMAEARATGLDRQVLANVVTEASLSEEARRMTLSVGDSRVAEEVRSFPAFQGFDGSFDREAYRFTLENNGFTA